MLLAGADPASAVLVAEQETVSVVLTDPAHADPAAPISASENVPIAAPDPVAVIPVVVAVAVVEALSSPFIALYMG